MILEDSLDMPPVKRGKRGTSDVDDEDEDYRRRRDRNNEAVKKSRYKSKQRTQETSSRVTKLKAENSELEEKVKSLTKDLKFLKDLFVEFASNAQNPKFQEMDLDALTRDSSDDKKSESGSKG